VNKKHVVGSATDYSVGVLTGSRTDVKLEANKEATLLDVFTNWKLPNFGMPIKEEQQDVTESQEAIVTKMEAGVEMRTPSQIALDNLRNRNKS
jgi:hypothetical protein